MPAVRTQSMVSANVQGPHGLAEWCARACDAASGCTAVSRDAFRRTCTLHGTEPLGVAERSTWEVRKCVQACAHVWMCAHRCFGQVTAADGREGVVCLRKPRPAVRSSRSIHVRHGTVATGLADRLSNAQYLRRSHPHRCIACCCCLRKRVSSFPQRAAGPATLESTSGACSLHPREYAECPTVSTPGTPLQVRRHSRSRRPSRRKVTSACCRILQVRGRTVPTGSTQSAPP